MLRVKGTDPVPSLGRGTLVPDYNSDSYRLTMRLEPRFAGSESVNLTLTREQVTQAATWSVKLTTTNEVSIIICLVYAE